MTMDLARLVETLRIQRSQIDRAIAALKAIGGGEATEAAAVKPRKRRRQTAAHRQAIREGQARAKAARAAKANGQAGQPTSAPDPVPAN